MSVVGSYAYGQLPDQDSELERLRAQATVGSAIEEAIWRRSGLKPGMRVLDLACGPGFITAAMARFVGPTGSVVGVDISPTLLEHARTRREHLAQPNLQFLQRDVYDLGDLGAPFDFVYARFLFQHLERPVAAVEGLREVLRPGGVVCVLDVDDDWLMVHPEPEGFSQLVQRAAEGQAARGGNRRVGRGLGDHLRAGGFEGVRTQISTVTSEQLGFENFINITTRFKIEQVPSVHRDEAIEQVERVRALRDVEGAWGAVGVFVATGRQPG